MYNVTNFKNGAYKINYADCPNMNMSQKSRAFETYYKEHRADLRNYRKSSYS